MRPRLSAETLDLLSQVTEDAAPEDQRLVVMLATSAFIDGAAETLAGLRQADRDEDNEHNDSSPRS